MATASLSISGMNCASCVAHVSKAARSLPGVVDCTVNLARGRAVVEFDPAQTSVEKIAGQITSSGYPAQVAGADTNGQPKHQQAKHAERWLHRAIAALLLWFPVEGAHWCMQLLFPHAHSAHHALVWIALVTSTICLIYVGASFYKSAWTALRHRTTNMDTLIAMGASVAYFYSLIYFLGGQFHLWSPPMGDELYFMESSALLALISLGHWLEANARRSAGSAIQGLMNLAPATALRVNDGERSTLNAARLSSPKSQGPTSNAEASPERWKLNVEGSTSAQTEEIPISQIHPRDTILLRPGDRVPVDGTVIDGSSSVDESFITGEPLPATRTAGDKVIAGTLNLDGRLLVRATAVGAETALAHIIAMVEKAQESRPPVQRLADQVSAVFVPVVLCIALVTGIGWFVWGDAHHWATPVIFAQMAKTVCSVLLIACPCALGLAVPAAIMVGTGAGARRGILIRDIDALQNAEKIETVVLDKTGTITEGKPIVVSIDSEHEDPGQLLRLAAAAEQFSSHPLAQAIVSEAHRRGIQIPQPSQFNSHAGYGVMAVVDGRELLVGNQAMLERFGRMPTPFVNSGATTDAGSEVLRRAGSDAEKSGSSEYLRAGVWDSRARTNGASDPFPLKSNSAGSIVYIAEKTSDALHLLGQIEISDSIKPDTPLALAKLRAMGLRLVMLTGDNARTAAAVAGQLGITEIHADVRPAEKAAVIQRLQADGRVAMVGDGINDAPALATANLGIALGSGSDIAKETGGIVLVGGSLSGVAASIQLSRATMRVIRQNLFLAFIYNVLAIPLAALGVMHPVVAAAAMALSDVTVLGNSLRLSAVCRSRSPAAGTPRILPMTRPQLTPYN